MKTLSEPSSISVPGTGAKQPDEFGSPEVTSLSTLTDGRSIAQYRSVYSAGAWFQIAVELVYLLVMLGSSLVALVFLAKYVVLKEMSGPVFNLVGKLPDSTPPGRLCGSRIFRCLRRLLVFAQVALSLGRQAAVASRSTYMATYRAASFGGARRFHFSDDYFRHCAVSQPNVFGRPGFRSCFGLFLLVCSRIICLPLCRK